MSEQSHIERERDEAMNAIQNIHRYCIQRTHNRISSGEFLDWVAIECEKVLLGEENARKL